MKSNPDSVTQYDYSEFGTFGFYLYKPKGKTPQLYCSQYDEKSLCGSPNYYGDGYENTNNCNYHFMGQAFYYLGLDKYSKNKDGTMRVTIVIFPVIGQYLTQANWTINCPNQQPETEYGFYLPLFFSDFFAKYNQLFTLTFKLPTDHLLFEADLSYSEDSNSYHNFTGDLDFTLTKKTPPGQ